MSRPTELLFRSPKEKTPACYNVKVTQNGSNLMFKSNSMNKQRTFSSEDRFK
jgi:hypothetical protein